jgi:hypothetical protein
MNRVWSPTLGADLELGKNWVRVARREFAFAI